MTGRTFGDGRISADNSGFFDLSIRDQLYELAFSHGCPIPDAVAEGYGGGDAGALSAIHRYAECNYVWSQLIVGMSKQLNPALHELLMAEYIREPGEKPEPPQDPSRVPDEYYRSLQGSAAPWGYFLPRILIEQFGRDNYDGPSGGKSRADRFFEGCSLLEQNIRVSQSVEELAARLANDTCKADADPTAVLSHCFAAELVNDEKCGSYLRKLREAFQQHAPNLAAVLDLMSVEERGRNGIAVF